MVCRMILDSCVSRAKRTLWCAGQYLRVTGFRYIVCARVDEGFVETMKHLNEDGSGGGGCGRTKRTNDALRPTFTCTMTKTGPSTKLKAPLQATSVP